MSSNDIEKLWHYTFEFKPDGNIGQMRIQLPTAPTKDTRTELDKGSG